MYQYVRRHDTPPRFLHISAGVERIHGLTVSEAMRDANRLFAQFEPSQAQALAQAEVESARTLVDFQMELQVRRADGQQRYVQLRSRPRRLPGGDIEWDGVATDVTVGKLHQREIERSTRHYAVLSQVNQGIVRSGSREELFQTVCRVAVGYGRFQYAWIGCLASDDTTLQCMASEAASPDLAKRPPGMAAGCGIAEEAIRSGRACFSSHTPTDPNTSPCHGFAGQENLGSCAGIPIRSSGRVQGILGICSVEPEFFNPREVLLLEEVAMDVSHALDGLDAQEQRRKADEALRESEQRFRALVESAPEAIFVRTGPHFTYVNAAAMRLFGAGSADELLGQSVLERFDPDSRPDTLERMRILATSGEATLGVDRVLLRMDGSRVHASISAVSIVHGGQSAALVFARDVTDRHRLEASLRHQVELQDQLARTAETLPGVVYSFLLRPDGTVAMPFASDRLHDLFGVRSDEVRQDAGAFLTLVHPDDTERLMAAMRESARTRTLWREEFRARTAGRGEIWIEGQAVPQAEPGGGTLWHGFLHDVTERKLLESQLRQSQKMEAIGQLAGGVAHDFNNILAAIIMQAELSATNADVPAEVQEGLQGIRAAAERAADLTRQLLLFGRRQVLQSRDLDLNETVTGLVRMLERLIGEDVSLQLRLHGQPLITHADPGMLDQVLLNLAVNARDAMPQGGDLNIDTSEQLVDDLSARRLGDIEPGRYVCLTVTDNGNGIAPEVVSRIYEPFFTTKEPGKGTGLGLATVFGITKQHRGWIDVHSQVGQGTTFRVFLPAASASAPQPAERPVSGQPRGGTEVILLVEDNPQVRDITRRTLERQGYRVLEAADGLQAIRIYRQHQAQIALLLTDMVMPAGINGLELGRHLRSQSASLRVIYSSGYAGNLGGERLELLEGEMFLQKPFASHQLLDTVRQLLDQ